MRLYAQDDVAFVEGDTGRDVAVLRRLTEKDFEGDRTFDEDNPELLTDDQWQALIDLIAPVVSSERKLQPTIRYKRDDIKKVVVREMHIEEAMRGTFEDDGDGYYAWDRNTGNLLDKDRQVVFTADYKHPHGPNQLEQFVPDRHSQPGERSGKPDDDDIAIMLGAWQEAEQLNDGSTLAVSIFARAAFVIDDVEQTLSSGGLHCVAVDSMDDPYIDEVFKEEKFALSNILTKMGIELA